MIEIELARHPVESHRQLDRIQVLALNVLNERNLEESVVRDFLNHRRYFLQPGDLGRPPASFTGHKLISCAAQPHYQWLNDPMLHNRVGKLMQAVRLKHPSRLYRVRVDQLYSDPAR